MQEAIMKDPNYLVLPTSAKNQVIIYFTKAARFKFITKWGIFSVFVTASMK